MFDIGWSELLIVAVVAIIVVGPKELPRMLRTFGGMLGKMRRMAGEFQSQFNEVLREAERQADLDDVKKHVESARKFDPLKDVRESLTNAVSAPATSAPGASASGVAAAGTTGAAAAAESAAASSPAPASPAASSPAPANPMPPNPASPVPPVAAPAVAAEPVPEAATAAPVDPAPAAAPPPVAAEPAPAPAAPEAQKPASGGGAA